VNPRLRRLIADAERMRTEFAGHPNIVVEPVGWDPPEEYRITYRVPGVSLADDTDQPEIVGEHRVRIKLTASYPREKPYFTTETNVFHPNFGQHAGDEICVGDDWTPAQPLPDLIIKIGEMLQYRQYNIRSPLNAVAGRWAAENENLFPVGHIALYQAEPEISLDGVLAPAAPEPRIELSFDDGGVQEAAS
jgi:ubiquitin-protein ligase